jgi:protease Do-like 1, chloroplastic
MRGIKQTPGRLLLGDVITGVDDQKVHDFDDLYNALDQHQVGDTVNVRLQRQGESVSLPIQVVVLQ